MPPVIAAFSAVLAQGWDFIKVTVGFGCTRANYFRKLQEDLSTLIGETDRLKKKAEHVKERVKIEETPYLQQALEVTDWLSEVQLVVSDVEAAIKEGEEEIQNKLVRCLFPKHCALERVGTKIRDRLEGVDKTLNDGKFDKYVQRKNSAIVTERPVSIVVGRDSTCEAIWTKVTQEPWNLMGLVGMGGIGKTTLLKNLNNMFCTREHNFDRVMWIDEPGNLKDLHEALRYKLNITDDRWDKMPVGEKAAEILNYLKDKKFLLLVDNLKSDIQINIFEESGVTMDGNPNGSKIVFTTRSQELCLRMGAVPYKVESLPPEEAKELFKFYVTQATLDADPLIQTDVDEILHFCNGMPLALKTMGRLLASRTQHEDWVYMIENVKNNMSNPPPLVEREVFSVIEASYNSLPQEKAKTCFLYFSLFSEFHNIKKEEIIDLWIGEGILQGENHWGIEATRKNEMIGARRDGEEIIRTLKQACLLEDGDTEDSLKMHDVIHAVAVWLVREKGKEKDKIWLTEGDASSSRPDGRRLVKKVSLINPKSVDFISDIDSPHLTTLIIRKTLWDDEDVKFLCHTPMLRVLSWTGQGVTFQPEQEGETLKKLHYLNLTEVRISSLTPIVGVLQNLRILILHNLGYLGRINNGIISRLKALQIFRTTPSDGSIHNLEWTLTDIPEDDPFLARFDRAGDTTEVSILEELESVPNIQVIDILLTTTIGTEKLLNSTKLRSCIQKLHIVKKLWSRDSQGMFELSSLGTMVQLETLVLSHCGCLQSVNIFGKRKNIESVSSLSQSGILDKLTVVHLGQCAIKDVAWVIWAKRLKELSIFGCDSLTKLLSEDGENLEIVNPGDFLPRLQRLYLVELPALDHIFGGKLDFLSLQIIYVTGCPKLRSLPFHPATARNSLQQIIGGELWWEHLEWENEDCKQAFAPKYVPVNYHDPNPHFSTVWLEMRVI